MRSVIERERGQFERNGLIEPGSSIMTILKLAKEGNRLLSQHRMARWRTRSPGRPKEGTAGPPLTVTNLILSSKTREPAPCAKVWPNGFSQRIGWRVKRQSGSHRTLAREGWQDLVFAFHEEDEIGPRMLARLARKSGLSPDDL